MDIKELDTPCFLVDEERVKNNCGRIRRICQDLGLQLRPHTKTHKTLEIAELQTGGSKRCIAVSTLAEAEFYAGQGFDDILLAHPISEKKIKRCVELTKKLTSFHVMVSDREGLACLKRHIDDLGGGLTWSVFLEVDTGYGRTGLLKDEAIRVACEVVDNRMSLQMLYTHCGNAYSAKTEEERKAIQTKTVTTLNDLKMQLLGRSIKCKVGTGSTPTCSHPIAANKDLGEFHPGNYVFYDYEQYLLNSCTQEDMACKVMTRVIAHKPDKHTLIVDCGFTALGHDGIHARHPNQFCLIEGESNLRLLGMSQELGKITAIEGELDCSMYPVGTIFFIYPYHACAAAAMHGKYYVHADSKVVGTWVPVKGW